MSTVTAAISMSHAPGMIGWPESLPETEYKRMRSACKQVEDYLEARKPDVIIAFLNDHFEQIYRTLAPTFAVGVADTHIGPPEYWRRVLRIPQPKEIGGMPDFAAHILQKTVHSGFDVTRMGSVEYGNNLLVVMELIRNKYDIPVVPIFINIYHPPLPLMARAYAFGQAVRSAVDSFDRDLKVAFLATGGLSHWPPIWLEHIHGTDDAKLDPLLRDMKRFQMLGRKVLEEVPDLMDRMGIYEKELYRNSNRQLTNPEWDKKFLKAIAEGDVKTVCGMSYASIEEEGGYGAHEALIWVALMGAMNGAPAKIVDYQSVPEWITGIGYVVYE